MSEAILCGVPVRFCEYAEGIYYFRPIGCVIAKDRETLQVFLDWLNKRESIGNQCVAELESLLAKWKAERRPQ